MRKLWLAPLALALGGAALLIPAGAGSAPAKNTNFSGSVSDPITVNCAEGASTGTATYTVSVSSGGSGYTADANQIRVMRGGAEVATLANLPDSKSVTDTTFPCPATNTTNGTATFSFQPTKGGSNVGTASTVTVTTIRTGSAS